jgi:small nuclear ribonucleoprotein (snRNP)-like protein
MNPQLDLFSPFFDAYLALIQAPQELILNLSDKVLALDNLYKARYLLPENDPDRLQVKARDDVAISFSGVATDKPKPQVRYQAPFAAIASSFSEGPLALLKNSLNKEIRVSVRRRGGVNSWCSGRLLAFDRHLNIILVNANERYSVKEEHFVSKRRKQLNERLIAFLEAFDKGGNAKQKSEEYLTRFGSDEDALWSHLHESYGVIAKVEDLEKRDVRSLVLRRAGHEVELINQLQARAHGLPMPTPLQSAEWVRLPSQQYEGNYYFRNNLTGESVWESPEGVSFRRVYVSAHREKAFKQLMIRGDSVSVISVKSQVE